MWRKENEERAQLQQTESVTRESSAALGGLNSEEEVETDLAFEKNGLENESMAKDEKRRKNKHSSRRTFSYA